MDCPTGLYPTEVNSTTCNFTLPAIGVDIVDVTKGIMYSSHGSYNVTRTPSERLTECGNNTVTTVIRDDVLNKTCTDVIQVIGEEVFIQSK